jgi:murein DD-endopeptidase MepM/ murein hydrolase activator NlpD
MLWRPVERPRSRPTRRVRLILLGALLAVNAAVILYHGDPRERMTDRATHATTPAAPESALEPDGHASATDVLQLDVARVAPTDVILGTPAVASAIEPIAGMRAPGLVQRVEVLTLRRGQTVAAALTAAGAAADDVARAIDAIQGIIDFRRLRPGNTLKGRFDEGGHLVSLDVHASTLERARARLDGDVWTGEKIAVEVETHLATVSGTVESSLWESLIDRGERPSLVTEIVDVFAWDIDFYREVYPGDSYRVLVEKKYVDGELLGYGVLRAAEFVSDGIVHRGYRFERAGGRAAYYDAAGRSLRKQLLKSPMKYGSVTSGFGRRRHPVLGYTRAHNGVDYGVPIGTPVWSVGDGRVIRAGWNGGFGRFVEIRHANNWISQYAHLSRILVKRGQRVSQKETVGKSGSSGVSTGPHLHYGLKRNGKYVNPATQRFERGRPLSGPDLEAFKERVERLTRALEAIEVAREARRLEAREG